jgi:hypothetical protein
MPDGAGVDAGDDGLSVGAGFELEAVPVIGRGEGFEFVRSAPCVLVPDPDVPAPIAPCPVIPVPGVPFLGSVARVDGRQRSLVSFHRSLIALALRLKSVLRVAPDDTSRHLL